MSRVVLLVDDDPDVLQIVAAMLEDLGCEVRQGSKLWSTSVDTTGSRS
jgi:CheY-like chemotaxis protein